MDEFVRQKDLVPPESSHKDDLETALDRELDGPKVHSSCHFVISSFFHFSQFPAGTVHDQMISDVFSSCVTQTCEFLDVGWLMLLHHAAFILDLRRLRLNAPS